MATIRGSKNSDVLDGTPGGDNIQGRGGNDTLNGFGGDDLLNGGSGADWLFGGDGVDTLLGGSGDDHLFGEGGDDILDGSRGNDTLDGGAGDDTIDGGNHTDTVVFSGLRQDYTVTQIDSDTVLISGPDGSDHITNVESFQFSDLTQSFAEVIVPLVPNVSAAGVTPASANVVQGTGLNIDWQIGSDGTGNAASSGTHLVIATAPDIGSVINSFGDLATGTLTAGTSTSFSGTLDTSALARGTYYIAAVADTGDVLAESNEADNVSDWVAITIDPQVADYSIDDMVVLASSDFDLTSDQNGPGARLDIELTLSNNGNAGPMLFTVQTYLSTDAVLDAGDLELSTDQFSVGYGSTLVDVSPYQIDEQQLAGDYYVISIVSSDDPWSGTPDGATDNTFITASPISLTAITNYGTTGDDLFTGTAAQETFFGEGGNDTLVNAGLDDNFDGGDGIDTVDFSHMSSGVQVFFATYTYTSPPFVTGPTVLEVRDAGDIGTQVPGVLTDVEHIIGTDFGDEIFFGNTTANHIEAGAGNDSILGSYGDDTIDGGIGDDIIGGMFGDDLIVTGDGFDLVFVDRDSDGSGNFTGHGHDTATDFDPLTDILLVQYDAGVVTYDPFADLTQTTDGVRLDMASDSSILLLGVDLADLNASNLFAVQEEATVLY